METLCESDVRRYVRAQRHGSRKVRNRTIEADLLALTRALNRATREKANGRWLLQENPLRGVELPKEKNPRQPVVTEAEFQRLLEVAPQVHPLLSLALVIAEGTWTTPLSVAVAAVGGRGPGEGNDLLAHTLGDVAAAGGWRDTETLLRSYQITDEATIRNVVLNPTQRLAQRSHSQQDSQHPQRKQESPAA